MPPPRVLSVSQPPPRPRRGAPGPWPGSARASPRSGRLAAPAGRGQCQPSAGRPSRPTCPQLPSRPQQPPRASSEQSHPAAAGHEAEPRAVDPQEVGFGSQQTGIRIPVLSPGCVPGENHFYWSSFHFPPIDGINAPIPRCLSSPSGGAVSCRGGEGSGSETGNPRFEFSWLCRLTAVQPSI